MPATFSDADELAGARFERADLHGARFVAANLSGVIHKPSVAVHSGPDFSTPTLASLLVRFGRAGQGRRPWVRANPVSVSRMFSSWRWASMVSAALRWAAMPTINPLASKATMTRTIAKIRN